MYSKLTEEELEFMQVFYNPKCAIECLFSDGTPRNWNDGGQCITLRNYQIPFLGYDSVIEDDEKLTDLENFRRRIAVGTRIITSGRKIGKCEYEENEMLLANGEKIKFKNLVGKTKKILSFNEETLKLEKTNAFFSSNGIKDCYKLITDTGKETIKTFNHPFYTSEGWKKMSDLKIGEYIATPRKYPVMGNKKVDEYLAKLLGYLLGDGSCTTANVGITNINNDIIKEINEIANHFNCDTRQNDTTYVFRAKNKIRKNNGSLQKNNVQNTVLKYGINKKSKNKEIPSDVFKWKKEYIALLLNRLFACDGHYNKHFQNIEITLASKKMIYQIQHLLIRFGIHSIIHFKKAKCSNKTFNSWRLTVISDTNKFLNEIGIYTKDNNRRREVNFSTSDRIPRKYFLKIYDLFKGFKYELGLKSMKLYDSSRNRWNRIYKISKIEEMKKIMNSDIYWERIKKIEYAGKLNTVAVCVPKNSSYVSDDIISHNTFIALIANILLKLIYYKDKEMTMSSYDEKHVSKIMDEIRSFLCSHNFFKSYKERIRGNPEYEIETKNGNKLYGINETIKGKNPGENFWGHHTYINFADEIQAETEEAYNKKIDAVSDFGVMEILCGITLISKNSPLGRIMRDKENKNNLIRLPQYVSHLFDEKTKRDRIRSYGGQQSTSYRINVAADIIEGTQGAFDMQRLALNYTKKRVVKRFEITKDSFKNYKDILILEPIHNASATYVTSDVGDSAATEITVFGKINNKYQLVYNITTYRLSLTKELPELMEYIFRKVEGNFMAVDSTIMGKPVYEILADRLNEKILDDKGNITKIIKRIYWVAFNEDIITGIQKDDKGYALKDRGGNILEKKEPALHFSVMRLQQLFYDRRFDIPDDDYKFELQFSSYVSIISGNRVVYDSTISEDHYVQSFEVFALLEWLTDGLKEVMEIKEPTKTLAGIFNFK